MNVALTVPSEALSFTALSPKWGPAREPGHIIRDRIARDVADRHKITLADLKSQSRLYRVAHPRQEAMYLIAQQTTFSLSQIGRYFGGRDHTTVIHACRAHARRHGLEPPR